MTRPTMILPYLCDRRVGHGYHTALVLKDHGETVTLLVPSKLATVTVPQATVEKVRVVPYRPARVRARVLEKARYFRQHGRRFPRQAVVELLRRLGAGRASIEETVTTPPLPATIAAHEWRTMQAERRAELAHVVIAIREKIAMQPEEAPTPSPWPRRSRPRYVHPDQLALAL